MNSSPEISIHRFVSITFDDGLVEGARKAVNVLTEFGTKATFYVVTGWIRPNHVRIRDPWNSQRDHGSWSDWQAIEDDGHEIGSHTLSHINATGKKARFVPILLRRELRHSYNDLTRHLKTPPVSIAMPWNASTSFSERVGKKIYQALLVGRQEVRYNNLIMINWYHLESWPPDSNVSVDEICKTISGIPEHHWLILQFHGIDDEGWMPISSAKLRAILKFIAESENLYQVTVRCMIDNYKLAQSTLERRPCFTDQ